MESFEDNCCPKIGIHSGPNEYMKCCKYKRSKSFFKLLSNVSHILKV